MATKLLALSDIHGNYPALEAVAEHSDNNSFDFIINCGDSIVYAPFANETLSWLQKKQVISILGNTDKKVIKLLRGKSFKKPSKPEKRLMYTSTAETLTKKSRSYLLSLANEQRLTVKQPLKGQRKNETTIGIFHGSPARAHEFLFPSTPDERFFELAEIAGCNIVITGHSHAPYHKWIGDVHFINPGSVGRMFDANPAASYVIIEISDNGEIIVNHYRVDYDVEHLVKEIQRAGLPEIYVDMYRQGRKLN